MGRSINSYLWGIRRRGRPRRQGMPPHGQSRAAAVPVGLHPPRCAARSALPCVAQRLASDPFPGGKSEWMMDRSRWNRCLAAGQSRRGRDPLWEVNFSVCPTHRTGFGSQCPQRMRSGIQVIGALFGSTDEKARQENPRLWSCPKRGAFRDHGGQVLAAITPWMQVRDGAVVFDAEVENPPEHWPDRSPPGRDHDLSAGPCGLP